MNKLVRMETALLVLTLAAGGAAWLGMHSRGGATVAIGAVKTTVGDLKSLHAEVFVRGREVRGDARLLDGDDIKTTPGGRARLRLDDGTTVIIDGDAEMTLHGSKITLSKGRVFVQAGVASRTEVDVKGTVVSVVSSAAAFEMTKVYCARGELVLAASGKSVHVASGETATLGGDPKVAPEAAFDDWTGGLAVPWGGERAPSSAIAEVWGSTSVTDPGSPLVIRTEKVDVAVEGELALTKMRTTYFNGSDREVAADIRFALPSGAIITRVARQTETQSSESTADVEIGDRNTNERGNRVEWAGGGWLRGSLTDVPAGQSIDLAIDYVEWLDQKDGHATYRFPMSSEGDAPMVGGLSVHVGAQSTAQWLSASTGAQVTGGAIELHRSDTRPTGDLVVELVPSVVRPNVARAYVEHGDPGEDPYLLVRTEVPDAPASGIALALVVDSSSSVGPALLETERAAVDALLEALGPKDSIVVLASDQSAKVVGPDKPAPVTPELRARIRQELAAVHSGGASNLGVGLERAADLVDDQPAAMVVYIGDGRPTVGEDNARDLRKRLARRANGAPRLGAIAVGQGADRWLLAGLVDGGGPVYEVLDRPDAARAGSALVGEALAPTLRDVSLDLGPTVDRIYPRDARTTDAGSTITVTGRVRGELPREIGIRYRRGTQLVEERRTLEVVNPPAFADVARRWAQDRVDESMSHADGVEPAIALAKKSKVVTPWTGWFFGGSTGSASWDARMLGLSPSLDAAYGTWVSPAPPPPSLLVEPPPSFSGEDTIEQAAEIAARHSVMDSLRSMVACRDARASIKPGVNGQLVVDVALGANGKTTRVVVNGNGEDDPLLDRCVRVVVEAVPFFASGVAVKFTMNIVLPAAPSLRRTECSVASTLPLAVRRGIWRARKRANSLDYATAAHACELPTWNDRRTLLGIIIDKMDSPSAMSFMQSLRTMGEVDAASFVREELVRRITTNGMEPEQTRRLLIEDEPRIDSVLDKAYAAAKGDEAKNAVLKRFLRLAPHSPLGRRLDIARLENSKDKNGLLAAIEAIRNDPYADAGLLSDCASTLRRVGMDDEGRRAFGELVERAPRDPWTLGYVGDRLRAEGLYEDALAAYLRLDAAMPDDPAVALRLALAHAGAGRLDVATRLLDRVAQTGGRGDDGRLAELSSIVSASFIARARQVAPSPETDALLARRLAQTPLPDVASLILVRTPLTDDKVEVTKDDVPADLDASSMGLAAMRIERGSGIAKIKLKRSGLSSGRPTHSVVTALVLDQDRTKAKLVTREVDIAPEGAELRWTGEAFQ